MILGKLAPSQCLQKGAKGTLLTKRTTFRECTIRLNLTAAVLINSVIGCPCFPQDDLFRPPYSYCGLSLDTFHPTSYSPMASLQSLLVIPSTRPKQVFSSPYLQKFAAAILESFSLFRVPRLACSLGKTVPPR